MSGKQGKTRRNAEDTHPSARKETWIEQTASFVGFFIYLLVLKSFFLPLFIIPTGSEAETLYGAHALNTCPNCGTQYAIGWQQPANWTRSTPYQPVVQCPNCRWRQAYGPHDPRRAQPDTPLRRPLRPSAGDRIFVHGWPFDEPMSRVKGLGPARWDVVVFKVPTDGQTNYIKRLIGLPNEKIELIDGDLFVNDKIEAKTHDAQRSLWFPYYDHDHPPRKPAGSAGYFPRWASLGETGPWHGLATRVVLFDGRDGATGTIQFVSDPGQTTRPGRVQDVYAYNEPRERIRRMVNEVSDVRLSAEVELSGQAGYVEFSTTKGEQWFFARLEADGTLELLHGSGPDGPRETWGQTRLNNIDGPLRLALSHVDGRVQVEAHGSVVLASAPEQYEITPALARGLAERKQTPVIRITVEGLAAKFRHMLIERDVYYSFVSLGRDGRTPGFGVQGNAIQLGPDDYFVLGDNSPNSLDSRFSFSSAVYAPGERIEHAVGPHLREAYDAGDYQLGTVPRNQMIGRAFFVYWPGFLPLTSWGPNLLPDLGRVRWIR